MKLKSYLKYSGIWGGVVVNPYHWQLKFEYLGPDEFNPNQRGLYLSVGLFWIRCIIDDGSY